MRKVFLLIALVALSSLSICAQERIRFGAVVGMNVTKFNKSVLDRRIGFRVGGRAEFPIDRGLGGAYWDVEALLSLKGAIVEPARDLRYNPYYLEIPVHFGFKHAFSKNFTLFASCGPYFAIGLFGKTNVKAGDITYYSMSYDECPSENVFKHGNLKRCDFGVGVNGGIELHKKYRLTLGYDYGMIENHNLDGICNRGFYVALGYMF